YTRQRPGTDIVHARVSGQASAHRSQEGFLAGPQACELRSHLGSGQLVEFSSLTRMHELQGLGGNGRLRYGFDVEAERIVGDGDDDESAGAGDGELAIVVAGLARRIEADVDSGRVSIKMCPEHVPEDDAAGRPGGGGLGVELPCVVALLFG